MSDDIPHGTYRGYQRCRKAPEGACDSCRDANAEYRRHWRSTSKKRADEIRRQNLRARALRILASRYPVELRKIIYELEKEQKA